MNTFISNFLKYRNYIGISVGVIAGFSYYFFVGCNGGSCAIWSSPYISSVYGGLMGYLLFSSFKKEEKDSNV